VVDNWPGENNLSFRTSLAWPVKGQISHLKKAVLALEIQQAWKQELSDKFVLEILLLYQASLIAGK
jgi:hypothetical protein